MPDLTDFNLFINSVIVEEEIELAPSGGRDRRESPEPKPGNQNWLTLRKREVLLSRVSIYIVFMFVACHR